MEYLYRSYVVLINNGGVLSSQSPEGIQTVEDTVSWFDEIYSVIQHWPKCPETKRISDTEGNKYCYCVTNDNTNRQPDKCSE